MTGSCEGCYLYTYDDKGPWKDGKPVPFEIGDELIGTLTIGFGHTGPDVVAGMRITQEQADAWLLEDVKEAEEGVKRCVIAPLKQSEYDSCTDQVFNTGETKFKTSTMLSRLNAGEYDKAGEAILMWYKTKGLEHGMLKRCAARYALFMGLPWERAKDAVTTAMTGNMMGGIITISMAAKNLFEVAQRQRDDELRALELLNPEPPQEPPEPEPAPETPLASPEPVVTAPKPVEPEVKTEIETVSTNGQKPVGEYKNYDPNAPPKSPLQSKQVHGDFLKIMAWLGAAPGIMLAMPDWLGPIKATLIAIASMSPVQMDAMSSIGVLIVGQGLSYYGKLTAKRPIR